MSQVLTSFAKMFSKVSVIISVVVLLLATSEAVYLTRLETRTGDGIQDGMVTGNIDLKVINSDGVGCEIVNLNGPGNTFSPGALDIFEGEYMQCCEDFYSPDLMNLHIYMEHFGVDTWKCDYINLEFSDGSRLNCPGPADQLNGGDNYVANCDILSN